MVEKFGNIRISMNCGIEHIECVVEENEENEEILVLYVNGENYDTIKFIGNKNELFDVANASERLIRMNGF